MIPNNQQSKQNEEEQCQKEQKSVTGSKKGTRETPSREQSTRTGEEGVVSEGALEDREELCLEEEEDDEKECHLKKRREQAKRRRMQEEGCKKQKR